jgi:hypothetical protein
MVGSCENGNKPLGSVICGEFVGKLGNCQLFKDSAPHSYLIY